MVHAHRLLWLLAVAICLMVRSTYLEGELASTPMALLTERETPTNGLDFITNEAFHFLKNLGNSYHIDLNNKNGFEEEFARVMTRGDKDTVLVSVLGTDYTSELVFMQMKHMFQARYANMTLLDKTDNLRDDYKTSEAGIWFFLAGVASTHIKNTEVIDQAVTNLHKLAQSSINGKPFYPRNVVLDLMEGSLSKMHAELAPLMRKLGYIIMEKGQKSPGDDINKENIFISAEFFQFWTELSVFVTQHMPQENIQIMPMTLVHTSKITITISNINLPSGGPLSQHQFQSLHGFLETKTIQLLSFNFNSPQIQADFRKFFSGFCKAQTREDIPGNLKLFLGKRHVNTPIRVSEFRFLSENFRQLQAQCLENISKFSSALDMNELSYVPVVDAPDVNVINSFLTSTEGNNFEVRKNALSMFEDED